MKFKIQNLKFKISDPNSKIFQIIDVNTNRAVEGLRVMEEIVRFVLEDKKLTVVLKETRGKLRKIIEKLIENEIHFQQRNALKDAGRELYTSNEAKRQSVLDIFMANAKRVQEALRVLEEFSKLIKPKAGKKIKEIRFKVYDLEQSIFYALYRRLKLDFDLYVVTDPMRDHVEAAKKAIAGGAKIIQLRDKTASKNQFLKWAKQIRRLTNKSNVTFIVNDYLDILEKTGADGIHLGQDDLRKRSIAQARKRLGEDKIIGVSTHSIGQALRAVRQGADYISVGPIFSTPTKPKAKAVGLKLLQRVMRRVNIPVVAIGGIDQSNIYNVKRTGCQRLAVIRAVLGKKNIAQAVKELRNNILRQIE